MLIFNNRNRVISLRTNNPDMTLQQIGNKVGVSKERVRQILVSENLETRSISQIPLPMPPCKRCGAAVPYRYRRFCSDRCRNPGKTRINCYYCNKIIELVTSIYIIRSTRAEHIHCSRSCRDNTRRGQPRPRRKE